MLRGSLTGRTPPTASHEFRLFVRQQRCLHQRVPCSCWMGCARWLPSHTPHLRFAPSSLVYLSTQQVSLKPKAARGRLLQAGSFD